MILSSLRFGKCWSYENNMEAQILKFVSSSACKYRKADIIHSITTVVDVVRLYLLVLPVFDESNDNH